MLTADEKLALIRTKVERAKRFLSDLEVARDRFIETKPYVKKSKRDPQTGHDLFYLTDIKIDPDIGLIAGDAIHNLRSALDHLAYQLVISGGGTPTTQTCFPISDSATVYNNTITKKVDGMAPTAKDKINAAKPYQGGTDELWWLHKLDIADKHHAMLFAPVTPNRATIYIHDSRRDFAFPRGFGNPLKDGDVFYECEPGLDEDTEFMFDVTLVKPQIIKGFPLVKMLQQMLDVVDILIVSFRPELV
jgi:hypothetical protein